MRLVFTRPAQRDLVRLRGFIADSNPDAARRAARRIKGAAARIADHPLSGRPVTAPSGETRQDIRDLVVPFGAGACLIRYQVLPGTLRVLRIWHAREDGSGY